MPHMPYSRRPRLVGNSLTRPSVIALRGDRRRLDPDYNSPVPYFDGVPANGTIQFVTESLTGPSTTTLSFSGPIVGFDALLAELKIAMGNSTIAPIDAGGCLGFISTAADQGSAWIAIVGGTALEAFGFDLAKQSYIASAGDLASAPEGGIGNAFGATLPVRGENFTTDTIARALGRVMANVDILASELDREEVAIREIGSLHGPSTTFGQYGLLPLSGIGPDPTNSYIYTAAYPQDDKVLDQYDDTREELIQYFALLDSHSLNQTRGSILSSYSVVGVVDGAGNNVLGVASDIITEVIITDIPAGDVVVIPSTSGVSNHDYAEISGATNGKWRNNGFCWAVEEVISNTHLRLRPMSAIELTLTGAPATSAQQPLIELCTEREDGESYGAITIRHGNFRHYSELSLVVDPPVPEIGADNDAVGLTVWAGVPLSHRTRTPNHAIESTTILDRRIEALRGGRITVGATNGQFGTLAEAVAWVVQRASVSPERWEILVLEDEILPAEIQVSGAGLPAGSMLFLTIRGASLGTMLSYPPGSPSWTYFAIDRALLKLEQITINNDRYDYRIARVLNNSTAAEVELFNVREAQDASTTDNITTFEFQDLVNDWFYLSQKSLHGYYTTQSGSLSEEQSPGGGLSHWRRESTTTKDDFTTGHGSFRVDLIDGAVGTGPGGITEAQFTLTDSRFSATPAIMTRPQIRALVGGVGSDASSLHMHPRPTPTYGISSASSGAYSTTSTVWVAVPNLTLTISTVGRPVLVAMQQDGSADAGYFGVYQANPLGTATGLIRITRNGTAIATACFAGYGSNFIVPIALSHLDTPSQGPNTYVVEASISTASASTLIRSAKLTAFEL